MILDDIADLFCELHASHTAKDIARHFERERKFVYGVENGCTFVLNPQFVAGLKVYGYELKLCKLKEENREEQRRRMMARYIDAEKVEELIKNYGKGTISDGMKMLDPVDDIVNLARALDYIPAADVQEIRRGRWIPSPDGVCPIRCSECNTPALWAHGEDDFGYAERRYASNFCPKCGAKMQ